jgi:hypothetical protein
MMNVTMLPMDMLMAIRQRLINGITSTSATVEFEDRRIERRSVDELLASLAWVDSQLGGMTGTRVFPRVRVTTSHKDL